MGLTTLVLVFLSIAQAIPTTPYQDRKVSVFPRDASKTYSAYQGTSSSSSSVYQTSASSRYSTTTSSAYPTPIAPGTPEPSGSESECGAVSKFYHPTEQDWDNAKTDEFLKNWISTNNASIHAHPYGFAGAFGEWTTGDPDFSCQDDGSVCSAGNICENHQINTLGKNIEPAYYVLKSIESLHAYFQAMSASFEVTGLLGALLTDDWVSTFYKRADGHDADDSDNKGILNLKEILYTVITVVGVGVTFMTLSMAPIAAAWLLSANVIVGGAIFAGATAFPGSWNSDNGFKHASAVGAAIGDTVHSAFSNLIDNNNILMKGGSLPGNVKQTQNVTIESYLKGGAFLEASVDKIGAIDTMGAMIQGQAINLLWKQNKIFIMGGGACGDNQGIGQGPQGSNYSYCDTENKAWYIYFWQANDVLSLTPHQWGWVVAPPGADQLSGGMFPNITMEDVIVSSIGSWKAGGYNYTSEMAQKRTFSALTEGWADPRQEGPRWEGTFTIPVCDVGAMAGNATVQGKEYILQDYGHDSRPVWCGPICSNDLNVTKQFIHAAGMDNFKSPKHLCDTEPGY